MSNGKSLPSERLKTFLPTRYRFSPLLGGDLNPLSGSSFPLFSWCFPGEFPSEWKTVEDSGSKTAANCCKLPTFFASVLIVLCLSRVCENSSEMRLWSTAPRICDAFGPALLWVRQTLRPRRSGRSTQPLALLALIHSVESTGRRVKRQGSRSAIEADGC